MEHSIYSNNTCDMYWTLLYFLFSQITFSELCCSIWLTLIYPKAWHVYILGCCPRITVNAMDVVSHMSPISIPTHAACRYPLGCKWWMIVCVYVDTIKHHVFLFCLKNINCNGNCINWIPRLHNKYFSNVFLCDSNTSWFL